MASGVFDITVHLDEPITQTLESISQQLSALSAQPQPVGSIGACVGGLAVAATKSRRVVSRRSLLGFGLFNRG